ncbi:phage/plasmid primase, P4 family [uncultured Deinococcus sp.]|uniref:phage/plasmid primase, P4 family n=1 Tax=uncultured Deinococcus sp. TaxID=158789 RepID=UPI0025828DA3|nr:phage/plasmid primase, P4 family [uncultured Deinococcus sp.]
MTHTPISWAALLYGGVTARPAQIEYRFLKGGLKAWMPSRSFEESPDKFTLDMVPAGKDAYFGVALRKDQTDGKAANCQDTHLQWADVDLKDHPELTNGQTDVLAMTADELHGYKADLLGQILEECDRLGLPARAIVDSGHGLQVYWARRASIPAAETEAMNRRLALAFGADTRSADIARILRLPGTLNLKNPARPLPVTVVYEDAESWVEGPALDALPTLPKPEPVAPAGPARPAQPLTGNPHERYAQSALQKELDTLRSTGEGGRNDALNKATFNAGQLVGAGVLDEVQAAQELTDVALSIGLPADEIRDTIRSAMAAGKEKPRDLSHVGQRKPPTAGRGTIGKFEGRGELSAAIADTLPAKPSLDDFRNLVLTCFTERGLLFRYHQIWRSWWEYRDGVYVEVPDEVMAQLVDLTLQAHGHTLKNAQISEILVKLGRDPGIGSREVDQGPWELNTRTGILDLESGELHEHSPEYFSIIQSAAHYRPEAVAHDWLAFLAQAVPDEGDRLILQQYAGLCLTGDTSPQKALLLLGEGGTGKGTFTRVLGAVLGNLATSSAIENIKDGSFLVGTLVGKRMCTVSELPRSFDWLPFKRITGEDTISVDVKNKTPYTTKLDMKLVILSNVLPFLGDDTSNSSLMRRFLPVAFNVKPAVSDPHLEGRLTHADELPGVLNWMLEGLRLLREAGMRFPSSDAAALAREIVEESNRVVTFLRDECLYAPEVEVGATELYTAYRKWCGETGHKALSSTSFAKQLVAAGKHFGRPIERLRNRVGTFYRNLSISTAPGGWEEEA